MGIEADWTGLIHINWFKIGEKGIQEKRVVGVAMRASPQQEAVPFIAVALLIGAMLFMNVLIIKPANN